MASGSTVGPAGGVIVEVGLEVGERGAVVDFLAGVVGVVDAIGFGVTVGVVVEVGAEAV